jgi:hypothetical protein
MVMMGENKTGAAPRPDPELESLRELLSDGGISLAERARALGEGKFFAKSQGRMAFLIRYTIEADPTMYEAAAMGLRAALDAGAALDKEMVEILAEAANDGGDVIKARVRGILEINEDRKEAGAVRMMRGLLFEEGPQDEKEEVLGNPENFTTEERMEALVDYALNGSDCGECAFETARSTYAKCASGQDSRISSGQITLMGRGLASDDECVKARADVLLAVAAAREPLAVLSNAKVGMGKRAEIAGNEGLFAARLPRSLGALIDFMMDGHVSPHLAAAADGSALPGTVAWINSMATFKSLLGGGARLADDHINRIASRMLEAPTDEVNRKRMDAGEMLAAVMAAGAIIPELSRRKIMNAATEEWPCQDKTGREDAKLRKLCALRAMRLVLDGWLGQLRRYNKGDAAETHWYFRAEDKRDISTDAMHPDLEIKDAARKVKDAVENIETEIFDGLSHRSIVLAQKHAALIVGMLVANTSIDVMYPGDATNPGRRKAALKMFQWMVKNGMELPRPAQLEIAAAAGSVLPDKESWDYEFAVNRKLCTMDALEALLMRVLAGCITNVEGCAVEWPLEHRQLGSIMVSAGLSAGPATMDVMNSAKRTQGLVEDINLRLIEAGRGGMALRKKEAPACEGAKQPSGAKVGIGRSVNEAPEGRAPAGRVDKRREPGEQACGDDTPLVLDPKRRAREELRQRLARRPGFRSGATPEVETCPDPASQPKRLVVPVVPPARRKP